MEQSVNEHDYTLPSSLKKLRACLKCKLVKTENQFLKNGCDNCAINMENGGFEEYTTGNFSGLISLLEPSHSWVAKWNHLCNIYICIATIKFVFILGTLVPGCYAVTVFGGENELATN